MLLQFDTTKYSSALGEKFTPYGLVILGLLFAYIVWYGLIRKNDVDVTKSRSSSKVDDENSPKGLPEE